MRFRVRIGLLLVGVLVACSGHAQSPPAWLRYAIPPDPPRYHDMPHAVVQLGDAPEEKMAADELDRGLGHMVAGTDLLLHRFDPRLDSIVLGTTEAIHRARLGRSLPGWVEKPLPEEGFRIVHLRRGIRHWWILQGGSPRAELYAAFRFAALVAEDRQLPGELVETPALALRGIDLLGDPLLYTATGSVQADLGEFARFARLMASVGINGIVTADTADLARVATAVRPYGMRVWPRMTLTGDVDALLAAAPNAGGVAVQSSARTHVELVKEVDGVAAMAARVQAHGGTVIYRGALGAPLVDAGTAKDLSPEQRAALLSRLPANVVVSGPAVSPLLPMGGMASANFGLLPERAQVAEFELFQPAMAQQRQLIYPLASWQRVLQTLERGDKTLAHASASGGVIAQSGRAGAASLTQPLLQANLYAFGRVAWNPSASADSITEEWARQTWGDDARIYGVAKEILLASGDAYVANSTPFGLPSLADAAGNPDPARVALRDRAGERAIADSAGVGVDRTATGTGEAARYPPAFAAELENPATCPPEWLLAFHRVPLDFRLRDGKSVVQSFYDAHFAGAAVAANAVDAWEGVRELVDEDRYAAVHGMLETSARQAEVWRDSTTEWMARVTGVPDALGYVGRHPGRVEAEAMTLSGYAIAQAAEPEDASGGARLACSAASCTAATVFAGDENVYRVETGYFDEATGSADFELRVNGVVRARWSSGAAIAMDLSHPAAERLVVNGVRLRQGDRIEIAAIPHGGGVAALDFVEVSRDPRWN